MNKSSPLEPELGEILNHTGVGWCGDPFCEKPKIPIIEAKHRIERLILSREAAARADERAQVLDRLQTIRLKDFKNHVIPHNTYCVTTKRLDEFRESELTSNVSKGAES